MEGVFGAAFGELHADDHHGDDQEHGQEDDVEFIEAGEDATEAFTEKDYKEGLEYLKNVYNTEITETDKIIKRWQK